MISVGICAALAPCSAMAANGIPENAANGDPGGGIRPCDLGGNFTIDEMLKQKPYPIRGVCAGYRSHSPRLTGQDLINMGAPARRL
jgi:hypothetical protein